MFNSKFICGDSLDRSEKELTLVEVHIRNARVETERVVAPTKRPEMHIMHFLDAFDCQDGPGDIFNAQIGWPAFEKNV